MKSMAKKRTKWKPKEKRALVCVAIIGIAIMLFLGIRWFNIHNTVPQQASSHEAFIEQLAPTATKLDHEYNVPASISLAQAILESNWGKSQLAADYNNLFGVKADFWQPRIKLATKEYENGRWVTVDAYFRVYHSWKASLIDHAKLMVRGTSWNQNQYEKVIKAGDYRQAAYALQEAGYATDPTYAIKLIEIIETYHLDQYDEQ